MVVRVKVAPVVLKVVDVVMVVVDDDDENDDNDDDDDDVYLVHLIYIPDVRPFFMMANLILILLLELLVYT